MGDAMSQLYVLEFGDIGADQLELVGGKGASLAELSRIDGVVVPAGFCVTTAAYRRMLTPEIESLIDRLSALPADDRPATDALAAEIRAAIAAAPIADEVVAAIGAAHRTLGVDGAYAVRSSATTEDLPDASFAGQQDSFLNVIGTDTLITYVARCWASLFTDRAVHYRTQRRIDHRSALMGVVVQRMVEPDSSGVLFTADPLSGHRRVTVIEANPGLGEALVGGLAAVDTFHVRGDEITSRSIANKAFAVVPSRGGGTERQILGPDRQNSAAISDDQIAQLAELGRRIEAHFGTPQDIEWCVTGDTISVVQSRPITTLFPIPPSTGDAVHVYVSVGHQQMMTDPITPLGLSMWKLTAFPPMHDAGGRLFVDVSGALAAPVSRAGVIGALGTSDPLIGDALRTVIDRPDIVPPVPADGAAPTTGPQGPGAGPAAGTEEIEPDPALVEELIASTQASIEALRDELAGKSGPELFDAIFADIPVMKSVLFDPRSRPVYLSAMDATLWLNEHLSEWLGIKNAADPLALSVPHNVTSEMGLALMDLADVVRGAPAVVEFLDATNDPGFVVDLDSVEGGAAVRQAFEAFLDTYGMRCVGEIDITRPRWAEDPTALIPTILANVRQFEPGEAARRFEAGRVEAESTAAEYLARVAALPDGAAKAEQVRQKIELVRTFIGYREFPKYGMIARYQLYKRALMAEAARLVEAGALAAPEDCFFLSMEEFAEVSRTDAVDAGMIAERRQAFRSFHALTPPRVMTSEGEMFGGDYRRTDAPSGALIGLAVSTGIVEGRARVVADIADADLEAGDILVTAFTDPSWTPVFVAIAGLVTEVGGLMTHGAVVAREYGLPAVVGVEHATTRIVDGQRIRLNGTDGYVEILS